MDKPLNILILEDSATDAELLKRFLLKQKMKCQVRVAMNKRNFLELLDTFSPDVILSDHSLPQFDSTDALTVTRQRYPHLPFILVTGTVSEEYAANIIKMGADDYILKDRIARLPAAIEAAMNRHRINKEIADYKYALDQTAIVAITDQRGIIIYANENFSKISKYKVEELIGSDHRIINSGTHPAFYIKNMWVTIAHGNIWRGEYCNRAKDGELYWVDTTIIPFLDDSKKPYQYLSIRFDITQKKRAEEELRKSEQRLKEAQTIGLISNYEVDLENNIHIWSDEYYRIFGMDKTKVTPSIELFLSFVHPDDILEIKERVLTAFRTSGEDAFEFRFIRTDGNIRFAYSKFRFEFDKNGKAIRLYGILQDVTQQKLSEEKLRKLQQELLEQQKQQQIEITATALKAQEKERHAIGMELHDNVNQILVGTNLFLSMIKSNPEKIQELVESSIRNLKDAIEENRKIAHLFVSPNLDTESLVNQLNHLIDKMFVPAGITTTIDNIKFNEHLLDHDRKLNIYRIAQEQCTNIVKYAKASSVLIVLSTDNKQCKMKIIDNGVGMDMNEKGTGIGLRNINGRLSIFKGTSEIITAPGKGFTLIINIPL